MAVEQIIVGSTFSTPLLYTLISVITVLVAVHLWQQTRPQRKLGDLIPGPPTWPIVGNALEFMKLSSDGKEN